MEGKDNRSKEKRSKMKQYRKPTQRPIGRKNTSSSDTAGIVRGGVIDVADSSDETVRRGWVSAAIPSQPFQPHLDLQKEELGMDEDDVGIAQMRAGDFDIMSQIPTSVGGHFQFSSEKNWESTEGEQLLNNTAASEYFTLNLKLLNVGLQTIPFYKRMDFPASMFSREQLLAMEKAAELAEKNYQNVLTEQEEVARIKPDSSNRKSGSAKSETTAKAASKVEDTENQHDELDDLLNITSEQMTKVNIDTAEKVFEKKLQVETTKGSNAAPTIDNKNDIEQWLDNVLDE